VALGVAVTVVVGVAAVAAVAGVAAPLEVDAEADAPDVVVGVVDELPLVAVVPPTDDVPVVAAVAEVLV